MPQPARWMTRDFVFMPPPAFLDVVAHAPERFELRPSAGSAGRSALFVLARDTAGRLDLDADLAGVATDLFGAPVSGGWRTEAMQLFGRPARRGWGALASAGSEVVEMTLVQGKGGRIWAFGLRALAEDHTPAARAYENLLQGLQERSSPVSAALLQSQFDGRERKRVAGLEADTCVDDGVPGPFDLAWDRRYAAALGEHDHSVVAPLMAEAVALVEEPYGPPLPLGTSRIGGGPDLPPGAWPVDARGLRHPFLVQIDLAEIAAACGPLSPLPPSGLLSFFVHGDSLALNTVFTPPGIALVAHPLTEALLDASHAAIAIADDLPPATPPGPLPYEEGDYVTVEVKDDGILRFAHSPDPAWAYGEPGEPFDALSDDRFATVATARLRPARTRSIDLLAAERWIEKRGTGSLDDLHEAHDASLRAVTGFHPDLTLPQIHQMLGHAALADGWDGRVAAAEQARERGHADLADPDGWIVLVRINAGSVTGREFWDALDLTIMAPRADVAARRWDRCLLLPG